MPFPSERVRRAGEAWRRLLPDLRAQGWDVEVIGLAAPLQLEGHLPCGERFYYRCRWDTCSLSIGGEDPADVPEWEGGQVVEGGEYAASHIEPDDAVRILLALYVRWKGEISN